jgi:hypothetical protein
VRHSFNFDFRQGLQGLAQFENYKVATPSQNPANPLNGVLLLARPKRNLVH